MQRQKIVIGRDAENSHGRDVVGGVLELLSLTKGQKIATAENSTAENSNGAGWRK